MLIDNYIPNEAETKEGILWNTRIECALLGYLITYPDALPTIKLEGHDFHNYMNRWVWDALCKRADKLESITISTLLDQLDEDGHSGEIGDAYIAGLQQEYLKDTGVNDADPLTYVAIIKRLSNKQQGEYITQKLIKKIYSSDGDGLDFGDDIASLRALEVRANNAGIHGTTWADLDKVIGPIQWDCKGWLPRGFLNIFVSMSGEGKSTVALRICGCYLLGLDWPDGTPFTDETGKIVWCEAEAGQAMNLERAKAWGYPIENILNPLDDPLEDFSLSNPKHRDLLVAKAMQPDVKYIEVDSLSGADPTAEKSTEDTRNVKWLASLARDIQKPIQLTHHPRKKNPFEIEGTISLDRVRGISTIIQFSRIIWALDAPDPTNLDNKRLSVIKSNLLRIPEPVGVFIGDSGVIFGAAPTEPRKETIVDRAADLILARLQKQPMLATDMQSEMQSAAISWRSVNEAKSRLGVVSIKKEDGHWYWSLPAKEY